MQDTADAPIRWPNGRKPRDWSGLGCGVFAASIVAAIALFYWGWHWSGLGFFGFGMIASVLSHQLSNERCLQSLDKQLMARSRFNAEAWGKDHRAAKAEAVAKVFSEVLCWHNHYLLPNDRLEMLWFRPMPDGGESLEVAISLQKHFILSHQAFDFETFGAFVDSLKEIDPVPSQPRET